MAIQANKPNNRVFLLLGIVLAALAAGGVLFALRSSSAGGQTESIVVAKLNVAAGTTLTSDQVGTTSVPLSAAPQDAFTDPAQVVGKTTTATITANTPLVPAFFQATPLTSTTTNASGQPVDVETQIVKGYVALAIPAAPVAPPAGQSGALLNANGLTADEASAGYYIQPGDHIDILIDPGNGGVRYSFQDVIVLRVGTSGSTTTGTPTMYLIEVPRSQAEVLTALITTRGIVKNASGDVSDGPFVIKYVLRPQSEWGKLAPDNSSYKPNYEDSVGGAPPAVNDPTVTPGTLQSLFAH